jgi:DNA-binding transcriptional LysR family regulator
MIDLRAVETLREVAARGSFSAAAEALHYTQPAISRRVAQLEHELGLPLVVRSRRGIHLTPAGELVVAHCEAVRLRLLRLQGELAELASGARLTARIAAFSTAFIGLVPALVRALRERAPGAEPTLERCGHDDALARVRRAEVDIALVFSRPELQRDDADLQIAEIATQPLLALLPTSHPYASLKMIELSALKDERWIVGAADDASSVIAAACRKSGFEPEIAVTTDDVLATQSLVAAGLGVSLSSPWETAVLRRDVVLRPLVEPVPRRQISAAIALPSSPAADLLLGLARECPSRLG